jgi:hypothetical protein
MEPPSYSPAEDLQQIRHLMERSSRFLSLSGLSGVFAGFFALLGAGAAWWYMGWRWYEPAQTRYLNGRGADLTRFVEFFALDAGLVLVGALGAGYYFTNRRARRNGVRIWDASAKRLLVSLLVPLATGGIFCLALLHHGLIGLIAPATLVFYGLALLNGGRYTLRDIHYLALSELALGLLACFWVGYGLLFWALGFGVLHIVYGVLMYVKYER